MAYLDYIFKIKASLHQETCQLQHGVSKTINDIDNSFS